MNRHRTVAAITAAFGQIVEQAATAAVADAGIQFARPDTAGAEPKVFIYLYQVTPNAAARNLDLPVRSSDGTARQRPFVALDLHYLLTFVGDEKKLQPQRMLGSVVGAVHSRPLLSPQEIRRAQASATDPALIGDDLDVPVVDVRFTPLGLSLEDLSKVWSVFFQTPYALSVVYRASMALLEVDIPIQPALPAQRPRGESGFLAHPVIAQVISAEGQYQPITADTTLVINGVRLRGEQTWIRVAGIDVEPGQATANRITLPVPAAAHVVGLHSVRVVHRPWDAAPDDAANEIESNMASFVLHPRVTGVAPAGAVLGVDVTPAIRAGQRAEVLLDQLGVDKPAVHRLQCIPFAGDTTIILQADLTGVGPGTYAVRIRVDNVTSRIDIDATSDTVLHTIEVPAP
jgi:Pvc16 N-terminal domain